MQTLGFEVRGRILLNIIEFISECKEVLCSVRVVERSCLIRDMKLSEDDCGIELALFSISTEID